jgi:hypothetical protein
VTLQRRWLTKFFYVFFTVSVFAGHDTGGDFLIAQAFLSDRPGTEALRKEGVQYSPMIERSAP